MLLEGAGLHVPAVKPGATPESVPLCEREPHIITRLFRSQESSLERFLKPQDGNMELPKTLRLHRGFGTPKCDMLFELVKVGGTSGVWIQFLILSVLPGKVRSQVKASLVGETSSLDRGPRGPGPMWVDEGQTGSNGPLGSRDPGAAPYCLSLALASRLSGQSENKAVHMGDLSGPPAHVHVLRKSEMPAPGSHSSSPMLARPSRQEF